MLEILELKDFDAFFGLMKQSFPIDEYRTYEEQKALLDNSEYRICVKYSSKREIVGFITVWDFDEFAYIEHFAVNPSFRNGGIGTEMLCELSDALNKMICLEVELPNNEMACRRIGFYERNHFFLNKFDYMQPAMSKGKHAIPLLIMTSGRTIDEREFNHIKETLYRRVYKQN